MAGLSVTRGSTWSGPVLYLTGDVDRRTAGLLAEALDDAMDLCPRGLPVTVDLANAGGFDSAGLDALFAARGRAFDRGIPVRVAYPSRQVAHLLETVGTAEPFALPKPPA